MKRRLLIAILVTVLLIVVATVVVTGVVPMGIVALHLDKEIYCPNDAVIITLRSLHTGSVQLGRLFRVQWFEDGNWIEVPLDCLWTEDLIVLLPGQTFRQSFIPAEDFSEPPRQEDTGWLRKFKLARFTMEQPWQRRPLWQNFV